MLNISKPVICHNEANKHIALLHDFDDFRKWYLSSHDFSMFSDEDILAVLDDEAPRSYPCIPLVADENFEVIYVSLELVKHWFYLFESNGKI